LNDIEIVENVLLALEYIAHILGRCAIYEHLYLKPSNHTIAARNLRAALPDLYAVILMYLSESNKHFTQNLAGTFKFFESNIFDADYMVKCGLYTAHGIHTYQDSSHSWRGSRRGRQPWNIMSMRRETKVRHVSLNLARIASTNENFDL
jgi:hypothetical protein